MPRGIPLSEEEREQVRRQIYQAATRLFLRQGFHQTSMRQIAGAVGLGKSTLYDYFPGKDDVLLYFIEQEMELINQTAAEIAEQMLNAPEKLRRILWAQWAYVKDNQDMTTLMAREASKLGEEAARRLARRRTEFRAMLEEIVRQGVAEGTFREVNPALAALALHSLIAMPFYDWLIRGGADGAEATLDALLDIFLSGIRAQ